MQCGIFSAIWRDSEGYKMHDTVTLLKKYSEREKQKYYLKEPLVGSQYLKQLVQGLEFVTGPKFCHLNVSL